jgi:hypothetical protein
VSGIFLMMAERCQRIFRRGWPVRVGFRADGWIPHGRKIERKQGMTFEFPVVEHPQFHDEVVWMLAVGDWLFEGCFSLLEKQRVLPVGDGGGIEAQHRADC